MRVAWSSAQRFIVSSFDGLQLFEGPVRWEKECYQPARVGKKTRRDPLAMRDAFLSKLVYQTYNGCGVPWQDVDAWRLDSSSSLAEEPTARQALHDLLLRLRLRKR